MIDHVAEDEVYCGHATPAMYGFQSYISMPIILKNGTFFGTLCAIDRKPAKVKNSGVVGMFKIFAEDRFSLDAGHQLADAEASLSMLMLSRSRVTSLSRSLGTTWQSPSFHRSGNPALGKDAARRRGTHPSRDDGQKRQSYGCSSH